MKILLDTNVVLDLLLERSPFVAQAKNIFETVEAGKIEGYLCATTLTTIYYLVSKQHSKPVADTIVKSLLQLFAIVKVDKGVLELAIAENGNDFEDSVLYSGAWLEKLDGIVTRDKKGFTNARVRIFTPKEFVKISPNK